MGKNQFQIIKIFQKAALQTIAKWDSAEKIKLTIRSGCKRIRTIVHKKGTLDASQIAAKIKISKIGIKHNIPQKIAAQKLLEKGITLQLSQMLSCISEEEEICLSKSCISTPDIDNHARLPVRALYVPVQPSGDTRWALQEPAKIARQSTIQY